MELTEEEKSLIVYALLNVTLTGNAQQLSTTLTTIGTIIEKMKSKGEHDGNSVQS